MLCVDIPAISAYCEHAHPCGLAGFPHTRGRELRNSLVHIFFLESLPCHLMLNTVQEVHSDADMLDSGGVFRGLAEQSTLLINRGD